ncbi:MAG TPA: DUF1697 domain-containing protein [Polyangiales bacterium]
MKRYAAFLRGVSPMNAKMPELVRAFEAAGFTDVKTIVSSGNVNFGSNRRSIEKLAASAEAAMQKLLKRSFLTFVRELSELERMLDADPFKTFKLPPKSKRIVTFLRSAPKAPPKLPIDMENARLLLLRDDVAFGAYVPDPKTGPVFMTLIERTFGKEVTTRTWDTVAKVVKKG